MNDQTLKFKIFCENCNLFILLNIQEEMKTNQILKPCKTKILKYGKNSKILEIAYKKEDKLKIKCEFKKVFAQIFVIDFKSNFLKEKIKPNALLPESGQLKILISALTFYDNSIDIQIVYDALKSFDEQLFLESFFKFNLSTLEKRWNELASFANENAIYLKSKEAFLELLKFLISNLESKTELVELCYESGIVFNYDSKQKKFDKDEDDFSLISCLISLLPKKIKIKKLSSFPHQTLNLICTLFEPNLVF